MWRLWDAVCVYVCAHAHVCMHVQEKKWKEVCRWLDSSYLRGTEVLGLAYAVAVVCFGVCVTCGYAQGLVFAWLHTPVCAHGCGKQSEGDCGLLSGSVL